MTIMCFESRVFFYLALILRFSIINFGDVFMFSGYMDKVNGMKYVPSFLITP